MPKTFYTDRDIEDLVKQGVRSLVVDDDVVLTDLAYEKARRLGMELVRQNDQPPAAPIRPYIVKVPATSASPTEWMGEQAASSAPRLSTPARGPETPEDLHKRIYEAVVARLGDSVDPKLLDTIIQRVLKSIQTS
jgi:hypothetical protein